MGLISSEYTAKQSVLSYAMGGVTLLLALMDVWLGINAQITMSYWYLLAYVAVGVTCLL